MTTKYSYYNPKNNSYNTVDSKEALKEELANFIVYFYMSFSSSLYTIIDTDDKGWESWRSPDESDTLPAEIIEYIKNNINV